ncbi:MAG: hypothetical protein AUH72_20850 [Acidobacteria bacterium 13_1_40CM_4_65_8]|nr:MAG: hypothetical protein AUH72_20850 [Acidobacteria bacterium 13_1_40CM_4_65_8]
MLAMPVAGYAQEAVFSGTVTDSTGAMLPGVTVKAVHEASGNSFEAVTDQRGAYRLPVRIGVYKLSAEVPGFTTVTRTGLELLVGQTAVINLQMAPASVQESVTVTAQSPLIETATSSLGGNIDERQVQELPSQGRNFLSLALLAPGNRTNAQGALPVQDRVDVREFQLNVDGQQVTSNLGTGNQSRYSNDSIAEFQFISNRFDATQGRSTGVQVNVVTKSGTNTLAGSLLGNFRNSAWNAADPVLKRVLPYKNQQISGTLGGPIVKNKLHFFGNYEYERQPLTSIWNTPYPRFNIQLNGIRNVKLGGARLDQQLSSKMRLMGKISHSGLFEPFGPGTGNHPSATSSNQEHNTDVIGQFTQVISNRAVNEVRFGYASYGIDQRSLTSWSKHWQAPNGITTDGPVITFRGFSFNRNNNLPRYRNQDVYTFHDDFTLSYDAAGRHDLKAGGEYLHLLDSTRGAGQHRGSVPGCVQRRHMEPCRHLVDHHALYRRRVRRDQLPDAGPFVEVRRVGAGRLEGQQPPHAESRHPLRSDLERVRAERHLRAVREGQSAAGLEQRSAESRLCVFVQRTDRPARWSGTLLQRHPQHERVVADESVDDRGDRGRQRPHAIRFRGEPVQRSLTDVRAGAAALLLREQHAWLSVARSAGAGAAAGLRARAA